MSAFGQKQTCAVQQPMSALPPTTTAKADFYALNVRFAPRERTGCGATRDVRGHWLIYDLLSASSLSLVIGLL
jgi:hypothetical protein